MEDWTVGIGGPWWCEKEILQEETDSHLDELIPRSLEGERKERRDQSQRE